MLTPSHTRPHHRRYRRCITPLLSLSIDFYVRVFVRVTTSPAAVKDSPGKLAYLWQSSGCDSFWLQRVGSKKVHGTTTKYLPGHGPVVPEKCPETGSGYLMGGPIWAEPIHDPAFVRGVLADMERDKDRCGGGVESCGYEWAVQRARIGCSVDKKRICGTG